MAKAIVIKCDGVASYSFGKIVEVNDDTGALFAAYIFGDDYVGSSLFDYADNGHDLTNSFAAFGENYASVGGGARLLLPFSGADVAAFASAITVIVVHKTPAANTAFLVSNYVNGSTPAIVIAAPNNAAARTYSVGATAQNTQIATDPTRGDQFVLSAATWTPTQHSVHYIKNGVATHNAVAAWTSTAPFGGANNLTISTLVAGGFDGASDVAAVLVYDRVLTNAEIEAEHDMLAVLLTVGLTPIA
ncbi:hypothetical protein SAMN05518801_10742 [Novosphingobium sp. CF614]|uniref:hypothetical protein n=1 Tax=Novosphingobium sp. CF614 TaxID=1884364 RepID=UPI0008F38D89|nr:hypothetical protein [Novosphingobium sp. CF614]SFG08532.1 hypothetical protein SAMN05518801_10742 [Novosphingobium sp. CF614]